MIEAKRIKGCVYHTTIPYSLDTEIQEVNFGRESSKKIGESNPRIAEKYGFEIVALEIMLDHVHLFISAHPKFAPVTLVKLFKRITARKLFKEFPELKKKLWSGHLWTPSYFRFLEDLDLSPCFLLG